MVQREWDKNKKMNIRKVVMYKRSELKGKYKRLMGEALDHDYKEAQEIRQEEHEAWEQFKFYSQLQEALDRVKK